MSNYTPFKDIFVEILKEKVAKVGIKVGSIDDLLKELNNLTPHVASNILEKLDLEIANHRLRKQQYYIKDIVSRTIITNYGVVRYKRRLYINKLTKKYVFLLDKLLKVVPYRRLSDEAIINIVEKIPDFPSYSIAAKHVIPGTILSKQTIFNCIKYVSILPITMKEKIKTNVLYISIDGFYIKDKSIKDKVERKFACAYTGCEKLGKKNKLLNSSLAVHSNKESFINVVKKIINNYELSPNAKVFICGDGARWIKTLATEINATFVIDKFHISKAINKMKPSHIPGIWECINTQHYDYLKVIEPDYHIIDDLTGEVKFDSNYIYLKNNIQHCSIWKHPLYIGCHAEQIVSHYFNLRMRSVPRTWGLNQYKILKLLALSKSKTYEVIVDDQALEYYSSIDDLFVPNPHLITPDGGCSCPHINRGSVDGLSKTLKSLLY